MMFKYLLPWFVMLFCYSLNAQKDTIFRDVIVLNNGYAFKCNILYGDQVGLTFNSAKGDSLVIEHGIIKYVKQGNQLELPKSSIKLKQIPTLSASMMFGLGSGGASDHLFSTLMLDVGLKVNLAKSSNNHFLRTNASIASFRSVTNVSSFILTGGYQYKLTDKRVAPFLFVDYGYGFNLDFSDQNDNFNQRTSHGGESYSFGFGINFRTSSLQSWDVNLGYLSQKATTEFLNTWQSNKIEQEFKRIFIKFGLTF